MLGNTYGQFDASGRSFVITNSKTPMPWTNVICNGRYGLIVSQNGGGFSWFDDAQHNVLTRWEMDLVRDTHGKFLFLSDLDSGKVWTAAPAPCFVHYDSYSCTHTLGRTTFQTQHDGIRVRWTLGVAESDAVEVWAVEIENVSSRKRRLRVASYFEWTCGVAPDAKREFHRLFFTTTHDASRHEILATKNMWDIPPKSEREHWNIPWPYVAGHRVCGFPFEKELAIADKSRFLGRYMPISRPAAMVGEIPTNGGFGRFGDACAALGGDLTLEAGATVKGAFLIGIAREKDELLSALDRHASFTQADVAVRQAEQGWTRRLSPTSIQTQRADFDLLNNHWLPYQAISGRLWGRTGYYQQSGAFGFRDQLQDSQVWLPLEPAQTVKQIVLHAGRQFEDGSVNHWWHALADFGNHTACSDDYLWLAFVTASYIKETGDLDILNRRAPFRDVAGERSLLDHCTRSIARALSRLSPRGLPHIGSCDWNDGLSAMGVDEKGESVWLGMFLASILADFSHIHEMLDDAEKAAEYRERRAAMVKAINDHAWDGSWYRYGTKDSGEWVGASSCKEGQIHLNAQTWAILTGVAPSDRADAAWASVREKLLSAYGPLLLAPAYTTPQLDLGYVTRYSPGSRENGGVYMHAATWALMAACARGDREAVASIWDSISPPVRGVDADAYWAEPYVTPGNVDGPLSDKPGRAGWTWYTGSAAWLNRVSMEWMLGLRPEWAGLRIRPCVPASFGEVRVQRTWRGRAIRVAFQAAECNPLVEPRVELNGKVLEGGVLSAKDLSSAKGDLEIRVTWPGKDFGHGQAEVKRTVAPLGAGRNVP
ncbi:MAG: glycosyl transferase family 36 [Phycisphaerales bacterium]